MKTNPILILSVAAFFYGKAHAQSTAAVDYARGYEQHLAKDLYETKVLAAAQNEFQRSNWSDQYLSAKEQEVASFFSKLIALQREITGADVQFSQYLAQNPHSSFVAQASLPLADYYLTHKRFDEALQLLQKVNQAKLTAEENRMYVTRLGYARFMTGDAEGAIQALEEAYHQAAAEDRQMVAYMLGHLYYSRKDYQNSYRYFEEIKDDPKYSEIVKPYYLHQNYADKNYDTAIAEAKELLQSGSKKLPAEELQKILGESYFAKGDYQEAYPYLKYYADRQSTPSVSDLYQLGFVSAKLNRYEEAVGYYNQIITADSPLAQNAYYQLGNAYLHTGKKQEALSAYRAAQAMTYNDDIRRLAMLQYAKLGYEIGNPFESVPTVVRTYLSTYPNSPERNEMQQLLAKSLLYSGNYADSLAVIEQISNPDKATQRLSQQVAFTLGLENWNKGDLTAALAMFEKSASAPGEEELTLRSRYYIAQIAYQNGDYAKAISEWHALQKSGSFSEKERLSYDLGYAYFKQENFENAVQSFEQYINSGAATEVEDARLRLAESYLSLNRLAEADKLISAVGTDTAERQYRAAQIKGLQNNFDEQIVLLKNLLQKFPSSAYEETAVIDVALALASQDRYAESNRWLETNQSKLKSSVAIADADLLQLQNMVEAGEVEKADAALQRMSDKYRNSIHARTLFQLGKMLYVKQNRTQELPALATLLGVSLDSGELNAAQVAAADQLYRAGRYSAAAEAYKNLILNAQNLTDKQYVMYRAAESYYQSKDYRQAAALYFDLSATEGPYRQEAQVRMAQLYLNDKKSAEAKGYLEKLLQSSDTAIRQFAQRELLVIYGKDDLAAADALANEVLKDKTADENLTQLATATIARRAMQRGDDNTAKGLYTKLEKARNTSLVAEALYAKAYYLNKAKNYKSSNEVIFKLAEKYAAEQYWGARALLVMSKNYQGLKDRYQANYTLNQIIENFTEYPDIVAEAKEIKATIK